MKQGILQALVIPILRLYGIYCQGMAINCTSTAKIIFSRVFQSWKINLVFPANFSTVGNYKTAGFNRFIAYKGIW